MRFKRSDMPGLAIAVLAPVGMFVLLVNAYGLWDHHGDPLLPTISMNLAIGAGLIGAFARFIKAWGLLLTVIGALIATVVAVIILQQTGNDSTTFSTTLKLLGVGLFLLANLVIVQQLIVHGIGPILDRRDARKAAEREAEA
jgi:hypothetical protein